MPLISVVIPLFNHEKFIREALDSVLNQTVQDFEIIVINDGSTDNSATIVQNISDDRIHYIFQKNIGAHDTINRGLGLAKGKYISILNSDDVYMSSRFERCLDILERDPGKEAVFSGIEYINENGEYLKTTLGAEENWNHLEETTPSYRHANNLTLDLLTGNFLKTTSNLFCSRKCTRSVGQFRNLRYCHDYDYFLRLSRRVEVAIINEPLLKYRTHAFNTLNENKAVVDFECALVLSDFLISHDRRKIFDHEDPDFLIKLFFSINTHNADRIMLMTLLFAISGDSSGTKINTIIENHNDRFWQVGQEYLANYHDGWQARKKIHEEWQKLYTLYTESEKERYKILLSHGYRFELLIKNQLNRIVRFFNSNRK